MRLNWEFYDSRMRKITYLYHDLVLISAKSSMTKASSIKSENMNSVTINILNPKAAQLLRNLEELKLISIQETSGDGFLAIVNRIRAKAKKNPPSLEKITKEVEILRTKRYAKKGK